VPRQPKVALVIKGHAYGGWQKVEITRSMEALCGSFSLELIERYAGQPGAASIQPGAPCRVQVDGRTVITGFVDDVLPEYDNDTHRVVVKGRDKTMDLVDCSAIFGSGSWSHSTLLQMARDLCSKFNIGVVADVDVSRARQLEQIQPGETVFEVLERMARLYAVVIISDGVGNVHFTRAGMGGSHAPLVLGATIEKANGQFSARERFSHYIVIGQVGQGAPIDPESAAFPHGTADDPGVGRWRPLVIVEPLADLDTSYFQLRALWEASTRAGRARRATITQPGWYDANGALWDINRMTTVRDGLLGMGESLLVTGVKFTLSNEADSAEITVTRKSAYELAPLSPKDTVGFQANVEPPT
jgi:prophage tail gpP-like protein